MKNLIRIISVVTIFMCVFNFFSTAYAATDILNTIFQSGGKFWKDNYNSNDGDAKKFTDELTGSGGIVDIIKVIGYIIFFVAGSILGIKYMISGVQGKTFAKEGITSYVIGAIFFYLGDQVFTFFYRIFVNGNISNATSYSTVQNNLWSTFSYVIQALMVAVLVFYGLKYMWANAEDKSSLKRGAMPMLVGAVLIMCTLQILTFVVNLSTKVIKNNTTYNNTTGIVRNLEFCDYYELNSKY